MVVLKPAFFADIVVADDTVAFPADFSALHMIYFSLLRQKIEYFVWVIEIRGDKKGTFAHGAFFWKIFFKTHAAVLALSSANVRPF